MTALERILRRTGRRQRLALAVRGGGLGLLLGLAAGLLLLLVDRGAGLDLDRRLYAAVAAAGLLLGAIVRAIRPLDRAALARRLDASYRLADRLSSAHALAAGPGHGRDPAFAALVARDADRYAERIDGRGAVPVRFTRAWGRAALLAPVLAAGVLFLPAFGDDRDDDEATRRTAEVEQAERVALAASLEDAADLLDDDGALDAGARAETDALADLARQLAADDPDTAIDPGAARDESAARLTELADGYEREAEREARAADELTRRFTGMESPGAPLSIDELADALQRGDLGDAADRLDEILAAGEQADPGTRRAAAEGLRDLGRAAEEIARTPDRTLTEQREMLEQVLRDEGLDEETLDRLLEGAPEEYREALEALRRDAGDEELADDLARDIDALRQEEDSNEQATRDAADIAEALERAAEAVERGERRPKPPPEPPAPTGADSPPSGVTPPTPPREEDRTSPPGASEPPAPAQRPEPGSPEPVGDTPQEPGERRAQRPGETGTPESDPNAPREPGQRETPRPAETGTPRPDPNAPQESGQRETPRPAETGTPRPDPNAPQESGQRETPRPAETGTPRPDPNAPREPGQRETPRPAETGTPRPDPNAPQEPGQRETPRPDDTGTPRPDPNAPQEPGQRETPSQRDNGTPDPAQNSPSPPGQPRPGEAPDGTDAPEPGSRPSAPGERRNDQRGEGDAPTDDGDGDSAARRMSPEDALREIERRRRTAEGRRDLARRAREAARGLSDRMTDEERRRWAESWAREQGADGVGADAPPGRRAAADRASDSAERTIDPLDLAGEEISGDPLAELEGDLADAPPVGTARGGTAPVVRTRARRAAERAIEQADVPARYHRYIRRYFERIAEERDAPAPAAPAEPES